MIGILSDAHGNLTVFRRMLELLSHMGADSFIFLGDAVGYIPSSDVLSVLMDMGDRVQCILGNHEQMLLSGQYPACLESVYRIQATRRLLSSEQLAFVAGWPTHLNYEYTCGRSLFVHGSPVDYQNGYVYPDSDLSEFSGEYQFVFMGHTHRAFVRKHAACTFINVGSCGLPRDDGRYASAALFDGSTGYTRLVRLKLSFFDVALFFSRQHVHHSVAELFNRRQADISGEIIEFK